VEWKELIIVPIYKGDKTDCSNCRGISLLSNMYKILSNILLSRLTPHAEEIIGGSSVWILTQHINSDQIFHIHQIFERKWENNEAMHQLFMTSRKFMIHL